MKKSSVISIIGLTLFLGMFLFAFYGTAQAGSNTLSFTVICSVPAIPGVNTPLLEKEDVRSGEVDRNKQPEPNMQQSLQGQKPMMLQQDMEQNMGLGGAALPINVKTFYSR